MLLIGLAMERGLIQFFYKRPHAEQILVTFGLAIVLQEIVKALWGANPVPIDAPAMLAGSADVGSWLGLGSGVVYPWWRLVYLAFSIVVIAAVFSFLQFTTYGMVVRAGMRDRDTVGFLGINIQRRFTVVFGLAAVVAGLAGVMYAPIVSPDYHMGMEFLVLSFVVVVVGGMGSLGGAILAGFLLGVLQSFASMNEIKQIIPGIDQIIIYLVAVVGAAGPPPRSARPHRRDGELNDEGRRRAVAQRSRHDGGLRRRRAHHAVLADADRRRLSGSAPAFRDLRDLRHRLQHPFRPDRLPVLRPRRLPRRRLLRHHVVVQAAHA